MSSEIWIIKFTNADGDVVTREFVNKVTAGSYVMALQDQGIDYTVTKDLGRGLTNWAAGIVNA